jgi:hypothetical protein
MAYSLNLRVGHDVSFACNKIIVVMARLKLSTEVGSLSRNYSDLPHSDWL